MSGDHSIDRVLLRIAGLVDGVKSHGVVECIPVCKCPYNAVSNLRDANQGKSGGRATTRRVYFVIGDFGRWRTDDNDSTKNLYSMAVLSRCGTCAPGKIAIPELAAVPLSGPRPCWQAPCPSEKHCHWGGPSARGMM